MAGAGGSGAELGASTLLDTEGRSTSLADLWREGPVVMVFLRHFG